MADETRPCPACGQQIQAAAMLCRYCKATFGDVPAAAAPQAVSAPPPKKSSMATCLIIGACVAGGGIVLIGILAALLLPAIVKATERAKTAACANNIRQMWMLQMNYMAQFGGRTRSLPEETGEDFWMALTKTQPPLVDQTEIEVFLCPHKGDGTIGSCDYRGPGRSAKLLTMNDPVGADKPGNHGTDKGGNVLKKDGSILEAELNDALWRACATQLRP